MYAIQLPQAVRNLEHEGNAQALAAEVARLQKENAALRTVTTKVGHRCMPLFIALVECWRLKTAMPTWSPVLPDGCQPCLVMQPSTRLSANRPPVEGSSRSSTNLVQVVAQLSDMTATNTQLNEQNAALREELAGMQRCVGVQTQPGHATTAVI